MALRDICYGPIPAWRWWLGGLAPLAAMVAVFSAASFAAHQGPWRDPSLDEAVFDLSVPASLVTGMTVAGVLWATAFAVNYFVLLRPRRLSLRQGLAVTFSFILGTIIATFLAPLVGFALAMLPLTAVISSMRPTDRLAIPIVAATTLVCCALGGAVFGLVLASFSEAAAPVLVRPRPSMVGPLALSGAITAALTAIALYLIPRAYDAGPLALYAVVALPVLAGVLGVMLTGRVLGRAAPDAFDPIDRETYSLRLIALIGAGAGLGYGIAWLLT